MAFVRVRYGKYQRTLKLDKDVSIEAIYRAMAKQWKMSTTVHAYLNNMPTTRNYTTFKDGDILEFHPVAPSPNPNGKYDIRPPNVTPRKPSGLYYMGHVYGVRKFSVPMGTHPQYLEGSWSGKWYSPRQTARCRDNVTGRSKGRAGTAPHENYGCKCGINMYKISFAQQERNVGRHELVTLTLGWGKTVVHEDGFRVQKALVEAIYYPDKGAVKSILRIPGFKKRGTKGVWKWGEFLELCEDAQFKMDGSLVQIPNQEATDDARPATQSNPRLEANRSRNAGPVHSAGLRTNPPPGILIQDQY